MTKNITLRMDEDVLRKAKHLAVEENKSLSAWIAELVESVVRTGSESTPLVVNEAGVAYQTSRETSERDQLIQGLNRMALKDRMSFSSWISKLAEDAAEWEAVHEQRKKAAWSVMDTTLRLGGEKFDRESCYDRIH